MSDGYGDPADPDPPECDREDCSRDSAYLLVSGDLCEPHAFEAEPGTVRYLRATIGTPPAATNEEGT